MMGLPQKCAQPFLERSVENGGMADSRIRSGISDFRVILFDAQGGNQASVDP